MLEGWGPLTGRKEGNHTKLNNAEAQSLHYDLVNGWLYKHLDPPGLPRLTAQSAGWIDRLYELIYCIHDQGLLNISTLYNSRVITLNRLYCRGGECWGNSIPRTESIKSPTACMLSMDSLSKQSVNESHEWKNLTCNSTNWVSLLASCRPLLTALREGI